MSVVARGGRSMTVRIVTVVGCMRVVVVVVVMQRWFVAGLTEGEK